VRGALVVRRLGVATGVRTRNCSFHLDERGFVVARVDDGASMELDDARAALDATFQVAGGVRRPVLVDFRGIRAESKAAREYFVSDEAVERYSAVAILIASPVSRVIGSFFMRLSRHRVPTRLCSSEADAIDWLLEATR